MLIDKLEAGGAQRQFCLLATSLQQTGFDVEVIVFGNDDFFAHELSHGTSIRVDRLVWRNRLHLIRVARAAIRRRNPDIVIGYLAWPNLIVELAGIPSRRFAIIVSERCLDVSRSRAKRYIRYFFHRLADVVVSNSYSQRRFMDQVAPHLSERTVVITNGVDTGYFRPSTIPKRTLAGRPTRILVLGRLVPQKNPIRFVEAVWQARARFPSAEIQVDWYGKGPDGGNGYATPYMKEVEEVMVRRRAAPWFRVHSPVAGVRALYRTADLVCVPSLYEGFSNVIGEAMACGVPVIASRVGDNAVLVKDGITGFLFDPRSVGCTVDTIARFLAMSDGERRMMGDAGRTFATSNLSRATFTQRYAALISQSAFDSVRVFSYGCRG